MTVTPSPCPNCGQRTNIEVLGRRGHWAQMVCVECRRVGPRRAANEEQAIVDWNRQALQEELGKVPQTKQLALDMGRLVRRIGRFGSQL